MEGHLAVSKTPLKQTLGDGIKMVSITILLAIIIAIGCPARFAQAALVSMWSPFGSNTITLDTETSLYWLDLTESTNYSYFEIITETGSGGIFDGYRLATPSEVLDIYEHAGINIDGSHLNIWTTDNYVPVTNLMTLVGGPIGIGNGGGEMGPFDYTVGYVDNEYDATFQYAYHLMADPDPTLQGRPGPSLYSKTGSSESLGSWLVADAAPVPVPASILLLGSGLVGLAGFRRKNKKT